GVPGTVRIIPSQGGESHLIAEEALLLDWSRDGRFLIIGRRFPSDEISAVPIQNGRAASEPVFIRASLPGAPRTVPKTLPNGTMIVLSGEGPTEDIFVGTLDPQDHAVSWKSIGSVSVGQSYPTFSPDGREIVYVVNPSGIVRVRDLESGKDRELHPGNGLLLT